MKNHGWTRMDTAKEGGGGGRYYSPIREPDGLARNRAAPLLSVSIRAHPWFHFSVWVHRSVAADLAVYLT